MIFNGLLNHVYQTVVSDRIYQNKVGKFNKEVLKRKYDKCSDGHFYYDVLMK